MADVAPLTPRQALEAFDAHAVAIAKRQYFQPGDEDLLGLFRRVANWVATPEDIAVRSQYADTFFDLMLTKRFCPGGRVLAGAATNHGNVLNCFVQDGRPEAEASEAWVLNLATKLAVVTKVGGGNGLNLDPIRPKRPFDGKVGQLYLTIAPSHADYEKVRDGTYLDLVHGAYVTRGYLAAKFVEYQESPTSLTVRQVGDSVESIWRHASEIVTSLLRGEDLLLDLTELRAEGTPVNGSGGTSSGPSSFSVEVFDNFARWAKLGGAAYAGPVATLRYVFAPTLRVIRQGGCLHPDTLVHTSRGTLRLSEIIDQFQYGWQDHHLQVATDEGWKASPRGFNNGNAPTLTVSLVNGQELRGTPNHKLKVMRPDARREWVRLDELGPGDHVITVLDQHTGSPVVLRPVEAPHHDARPATLPETLTERLAFFLGYLWGDGFVTDDRVGVSVSHDSPMIDEAPELFRELFGIEVDTEQHVDDASLVYVAKAAHLVAWLRANGLAKAKARALELPRPVRMAPRPVLGAFLRGLFEADGTLEQGYPSLATASKRLAADVATALAGLGIPTSIRTIGPRRDRLSRHGVQHVRVSTRRGLDRFVERIGLTAGSRLVTVARHARREAASDRSAPLPHGATFAAAALAKLPPGAKGRPVPHAELRTSLLRYARGDRGMSADALRRLRARTSATAFLPESPEDEHYVAVRSVTEGGRSLTLDLSVDENMTYLANGVVSHNTRRGAGMATMSITHPDVEDFITAKDLERERAEGDISTFNISVLVSDDYMEAAKDTGGSGVLRDIAEHAWATGEPGLIYIDRINEHNPMRASLGEIKATNPCFPADVRIATHRGLVTLGELHASHEPLLVASDRRVLERTPGVALRAAVPVFMTSAAERVYRVVTEHGYQVRATADHRFLTPDGWTELRDLRPGATLLVQSAEGAWSDRYELPAAAGRAPVAQVATALGHDRAARTERSDVRLHGATAPSAWSRELGTLLGFVSGGALAGAGEVAVRVAREDADELQPYVATYRRWFGGGAPADPIGTELRLEPAVAEELEALGLSPDEGARVPAAVFTAPRPAVVGYLQGLFTADGDVAPRAGGASSVRLASASRALLEDVQLLLSNFGIVARIARRATGEARAAHELLLYGASHGAFLEKIGFLAPSKQRTAEAIAGEARSADAERFETTVVEVVLDGVESVYDTTEPVAHAVVANGIVAHQCGEIPLFPGEPCDLGAINLAAYVTESDAGLTGFDTAAFRRDVATCIRFLDNVLDVNRFALEDNREMSHYLRRLGLGIMGLADALIRMGFRYDSPEGREAVKAIITELREAATAASRDLARVRGAFPGIGESSLAEARRNIALLTVAPTGTTSMLMGVSSGVEPIFAPFIHRKIGSTYAAIIAPLFKELLERHPPHPDFVSGDGWDWDKVVERVQEQHGSVQGLDFIPDDVKAVLVCAHDIAPEDHVLMQGAVQSAFDAGDDMVANSISKTINMPNHATVDDVYRAYSLAFETNCKGITVYRDGSRQYQVLSTSSEKKEKRQDVGTVAAAPAPAEQPVTPVATGNGAPRRLANPAFERLPSEPLFDRPIRLEGFTDAAKLTLPTGETRGFYVTVNKQDGLPVECFVTSGKAGDEANADSEALGRLVSVALQYGVPAEAIVKTLRGINGGMYGTYQGRMVTSRADLIAVALETAGVENVLNRGKGCPDCGAPLHFEEGCMKCESCGYSKCG